MWVFGTYVGHEAWWGEALATGSILKIIPPYFYNRSKLKSVDDHVCKPVALDLTLGGILSCSIQTLWN